MVRVFSQWFHFCMICMSRAVLISGVGLLMALGSLASAESADPQSQSATNLPDEVSIKEDRKSLENFRKDIPDEKKKENDELAALLKLMPLTDDKEPSEFRSRFNSLVSKRRDTMNELVRKQRDSFNADEKRNRETALKALADDRAKYLKDKHTSDERNSFFGRQEDLRRGYFSKQSDKRKDFESEMQDKRKEFDDHIREVTGRFNDLYRDYLSRYYERKKNEALKKRMEEKTRQLQREQDSGMNQGGYGASGGAGSSLGASVTRGEDEAVLREFKNIPKTPAVPLGAGDSN